MNTLVPVTSLTPSERRLAFPVVFMLCLIDKSWGFPAFYTSQQDQFHRQNTAQLYHNSRLEPDFP
jgi:hypothetical protein